MNLLYFYKTVWISFGKYKWKSLLLFLVILLSAAGEGFNIAFLLPILSYVFDDKSITSNFFLSLLGKFFGLNNLFMALMIIFFIVVLLKNALKVLSGYLSPSLVWSVRNYWTNSIIQRYLYWPYHKMIEHKQGYLVNNAIEEPLRASKLLTDFIQFNSTLLFVISIYMTLIISNLKMTIMLTVVVFLTIMVLRKKLIRISVDSGHKRLQYQQQLHSYLAESIAGFREVKIFQVENKIMGNINKILRHYRKISIIFGVGNSLPAPLIETIFSALIVIVSIYFITHYGSNAFKEYLPMASVFIIGGLKLFTYFSLLSSEGMGVMNLWPSYMKVLEEIDEDEKYKDRSVNKADGKEDTGDKKILLRSSIRLENIQFKYGDKIILNNINILIHADKITFIVGKSGIGKTTLAFLLLGLIKPQNGKIYFDNQCIKDDARDDILGICSYVSQDNFLFHSTIRENITFGARNEIDESRFNKICSITHVDSFVNKLPEGYKTIVGDKGDKFSEGQKQRIALARALTKDAQIYIFDEPTSNLDKETSKILKDILKYLKDNNKTCIVITHKEEDLKLADKIIKL